MRQIPIFNTEKENLRVTNEGMGECDVFMAVEDCNNKAWNIVDNW